MTLGEFTSKWYKNETPILVVHSQHLDDVLDAFDDTGDIARGLVEFCFDIRWSQMKCRTYLKERWAFGEVEAFFTANGYMVVVVEPKKEASGERTDNE